MFGFEEDDTTPEEKAALLAQALRGATPAALMQQAMEQRQALAQQQGFGELGLLTGDKVLGQFGREALGEVAKEAPNSLRQLTLAQSTERLRAAAEREKRLAAHEARKDGLAVENTEFAHDMATKGMTLRERMVDAAERRATKAANKKQLIPVSEAKTFGEVDTAVEALEALGAKFDASGAAGAGGAIMGWLGDKTKGAIGGDVKQFMDTSRQTMQVAGKILEGGKMTAGDETKYTRLQPETGDTPEVRLNKVRGMVELLKSLRTNSIESLGASGYDVAGLRSKYIPDAAVPPIDTTEQVVEPDLGDLESQMAPMAAPVPKPDVDLVNGPPAVAPRAAPRATAPVRPSSVRPSKDSPPSATARKPTAEETANPNWTRKGEDVLTAWRRNIDDPEAELPAATFEFSEVPGSLKAGIPQGVPTTIMRKGRPIGVVQITSSGRTDWTVKTWRK